MSRKSRTTPPSTSRPRAKVIPEPFHVVSAATVTRKGAKPKVPMLVIYGEWLKTIGFPIGSAAYLTTDRHGELALRRIGLAMPRRLFISTAPR